MFGVLDVLTRKLELHIAFSHVRPPRASSYNTTNIEGGQKFLVYGVVDRHLSQHYTTHASSRLLAVRKSHRLREESQS